MPAEHWTTDRVGVGCEKCGKCTPVMHLTAGSSNIWWCAACCPHCNRPPTEPPAEPMQPIGVTIAGEQSSLFAIPSKQPD